MATECPKCGEVIPDDARARAGRARWAGVSAQDRSEAARRASGARWSAHRTPPMRTLLIDGDLSAGCESLNVPLAT